MDCSTPGFSVFHQFPEFAQTHGHWVGDANQPSHSLSSPSPLIFNLSQHQGLISNESALFIRWPKYWSFSFSISPKHELESVPLQDIDSWISIIHGSPWSADQELSSLSTKTSFFFFLRHLSKQDAICYMVLRKRNGLLFCILLIFSTAREMIASPPLIAVFTLGVLLTHNS